MQDGTTASRAGTSGLGGRHTQQDDMVELPIRRNGSIWPWRPGTMRTLRRLCEWGTDSERFVLGTDGAPYRGLTSVMMEAVHPMRLSEACLTSASLQPSAHGRRRRRRLPRCSLWAGSWRRTQPCGQGCGCACGLGFWLERPAYTPPCTMSISAPHLRRRQQRWSGQRRDLLVSQDQEAAEYDPQEPLDYGQTYYWRIDEVNAAPDNTIFKGNVWSFTTEPYGYAMTGVTAKASMSRPLRPPSERSTAPVSMSSISTAPI